MSQSTYLRMCRSCGADFAKTVKVCPHCGKKVQSGTLLMLIIGLGCLAVVAAFALPVHKGQSDEMKTISVAAVDQINAAELAAVFGNKKTQNDPGTRNKVKEITGKVVQWDLEVFVSTKTGDYYQMVTKPTADVPGTLLKVYPQDNQQKNYLESIKPGNTIKIKGKIAGIQQGRIKIDPAIII
jgi:Tfp pilus assembly protein FimT